MTLHNSKTCMLLCRLLDAPFCTMVEAVAERVYGLTLLNACKGMAFIRLVLTPMSSDIFRFPIIEIWLATVKVSMAERVFSADSRLPFLARASALSLLFSSAAVMVW